MCACTLVYPSYRRCDGWQLSRKRGCRVTSRVRPYQEFSARNVPGAGELPQQLQEPLGVVSSLQPPNQNHRYIAAAPAPAIHQGHTIVHVRAQLE